MMKFQNGSEIKFNEGDPKVKSWVDKYRSAQDDWLCAVATRLERNLPLRTRLRLFLRRLTWKVR